MNLTDCLEKLYLADNALDAKELFSVSKPSKKQKALLDEWIQTGYLSEFLLKRKKLYKLTDYGIRFLHQNDPAHWQDISQEKNRRKKELLHEFLSLLEKKSGKPISSSDRNKYSDLIQTCLHEGKIELIASNRYSLTSLGKNSLFLLKPSDEILAGLNLSLQSLISEVDMGEKAHRSIAEDFRQQEPGFYKFIEDHFGHVKDYISHAIRELQIVQKRTEIMHMAREQRQSLIKDIETIKTHFYQTLEEARESIIKKFNDWTSKCEDKLQKQQKTLALQNDRLREQSNSLLKHYRQIHDLIQQENEVKIDTKLEEEAEEIKIETPYKQKEWEEEFSTLDPQKQFDTEVDLKSVAEQGVNELFHGPAEVEEKSVVEQVSELFRQPEDSEETENIEEETIEFEHGDAQVLVYNTAKKMIETLFPLPIPDLLNQTRRKMFISEKQFEHVLRTLQPSLQLQPGNIEEQKGGVTIAGTYYYYVTAVY